MQLSKWIATSYIENTSFCHFSYLHSLIPVITESLEPTLEKLKLQADGVTRVAIGKHIKKLTLEAHCLVMLSLQQH